MKKKILAALMVGILAMTMIGCSKNDENQNENPENGTDVLEQEDEAVGYQEAKDHKDYLKGNVSFGELVEVSGVVTKIEEDLLSFNDDNGKAWVLVAPRDTDLSSLSVGDAITAYGSYADEPDYISKKIVPLAMVKVEKGKDTIYAMIGGERVEDVLFNME